jgi:predicted transposase/invertase (TIGR01784 family)
MPRFYDPTNDVAFKKLFVTPENKPLLIGFLNSVLRRVGEDRIEEVEILPTEMLPRIPEAKNSLLYIRCTDQKKFQYIVEIQKRELSYFMQHYVARTYSSQLDVGDDYLQLKPVVFLGIVKGQLFPQPVDYISFHHTLEAKTQCNYLKDLSYAFIELTKFKKQEKDLETEEDYWIYLFKKASKEDHIPDHAPGDIQRAYEILESYRWSPLEREVYERQKMAEMDDRDAESTAIAKGEKKGREEGLKEGLEKGLEKGREEGLEKGREEGLEKGREEGLEKGREEGEKKKALEIAKTLLKQDIPFALVQQSTGLLEEEIRGLIQK